MALTLTRLSDPAFAGFDDIIDVRSPAEFAEDHLPGAINLPVLDDAERARVGTIYKQISPFEARKIGGALVISAVARHIAGPLAGHDGSWKPLLYCWRGGQRSGAFTTLLREVGWRAERIEGGYKTWRRLVVDRVQNGPIPSPVIVLDGNTGSAKTEILLHLAERGHQVIDLEGLANHRGSVFGGMAGGQPSQKMFEGRLALAFEALDPARPVLVEAESSRIGNLNLPKAMWQALCAAPRIRLEVPVAARAALTADRYAEVLGDDARMTTILAQLAPFHPAARIDLWRQMLVVGDLNGISESLLRDHYDPRYLKHRLRHAAGERAVVALSDLRDLVAAAGQVEAALARLT